MTLLSRIKGFLGFAPVSRATPEEKSLMSLGFGSSGRTGIGRNKREIAQEYEENAHLRGPFSRVATDTAMNPWKLFREGRDTRTEVKRHPILDLLESPFPGMVRKVWLELICLYLDLHGEFFLGIEFGLNGDPVSLAPIPPHWVTKTPSQADPSYTICPPGGITRKRKPGEVIWHKSARPLNPYGRGVGAASSLDDEIAQIDNISQFVEAYFGNGCTLGSVLSVEGAQDPKRLRDQFEQRHSGVANSFRLAVIPGKATLTNVNNLPKDLETNQNVKSKRDFIRQTIGTPPEIHGQTENSNKATAQAAENLHQAYGLRPRLEEMCQVFNVYLVPLFVGSERLVLAYCNPVQKTEEFRLDRSERGQKSGFMTLNEARHEQDLDTDPEGDVYFIPLNMRVIRRSDLGRFADLQLLEAENKAKSALKQDNSTQNSTKNPENQTQKALPGKSLDAYLQEVSQ